MRTAIFTLAFMVFRVAMAIGGELVLFPDKGTSFFETIFIIAMLMDIADFYHSFTK